MCVCVLYTFSPGLPEIAAYWAYDTHFLPLVLAGSEQSADVSHSVKINSNDLLKHSRAVS